MKNLKRLFVLVFAVLFMAGLGLAGCGKTASSVTVYAYNYNSESESWEEVAKKTVDAHNNLVLETPEAEPPEGKEFYGWSTSQNWQEGSSDFVIEGNYVSYNNVKNAATKGTIKLYPAYKTQVEYYFVFGVYTYETRSGITAANVEEIRTALLSYLETEQHATEDQLALVDVREYSDAGVADYGAKIMKKGDVDVFVGCGNNINTDGGVSIVAKSKAFAINGTTGRRFIILNDDDLSIAVYNWFQTYIHDNFDSTYTPENYVKVECTVTYTLGANHHEDAVAPAAVHVYNNHTITLPEGPAAADGYVFAGWKVGDDAELKAAGAKITVNEDVTVTAQYTVDATAVTNTTMQIAYLVYKDDGSTSGFSKDGGAAYIDSVIAAFATYLDENGVIYGNNITGRAYIGKASDEKAEINTDLGDSELNIGIVLGFNNNNDPDYIDRQGGFNMGTKTGNERWVLKTKDNAISNIAYDWMVTPGSTFVTAVVTPAA